jgi:hypothetical protein
LVDAEYVRRVHADGEYNRGSLVNAERLVASSVDAEREVDNVEGGWDYHRLG